MHTEKIYHENRHAVCQRTRRSARGIVIKNGKLLLVKNEKQDIFMLPGGGLEDGETIEECCVRELLEETGYICKTISTKIKVEEYCHEMCFLGQYFVCEIIAQGEKHLTEDEKKLGCAVHWVDLQEALTMFENYEQHKDYWEKFSTYLRDHTGLKYALS